MQQILRRVRRSAVVAVAGAVLGTLAFAPTAQAQDPAGQGSSGGQGIDPRKMVDQRMAVLTEALRLDTAQQSGIRWIIAGETMDLEELRNKSGGHRAGGGDGGGRGVMGGRRGGGGGGGRRGGASADSTGGGEGGSGPPAEVRAIRDRADKQIEKLLNPEQLTAYRQMFEQHYPRAAGDSSR